MRQPRPQMIPGAVKENLRLIFQPPEGSGMNDPGPVPLKLGPVSVAGLGILAAARFTGLLGERRQHAQFIRLHLFPRLPTLPPAVASRQIIRHDRLFFARAGFASPELGVLSSDSARSLYPQIGRASCRDRAHITL